MKQVRKGKIFAMVGFLGLFTGVLLSACSKPTEEDSSLSKVEEAKTLVVATSGTLYPSSYYNDKNELVGYDVDVAKEVAKRLGVEITFKEYNVDGQVSSLTRGEADFAANDFGLTDERAEKFSLSTPIKYSFDSMIVRKSDDSGIASLEDLDGKKAAGEPNTSYMRLAESYGAELVTYDNATNDQYLTDVANGRTDVILNDYYLQKMAVAALPDIPVKILEDVYFNPNETGFLFVKDHKALQEKVDAVLAEMKEDGRLKELAETYFQTDISVKSDQAIQTVETD
ncbi:polar amino acid ABC superfamily ATP binding cassette transporter, binding protein [Enterococcus sp. C1]|uniref:transporter substrate-binding domain-containing protein n=1 Tax=Enterococcus sp. C1 TaxID=1182762 RepID=UPI000271FA81|nr:transporter substrate-binding domain-containing protein [Enterococcus sp. C1]EJF49130.1 polar amino acid ABC superfamily ATP binding cassette transporter, binding protein [Enterococcus sp. C1]